MESELKQDRSIQADVRPASRFLRFGLASMTTLVLGGIILGVTSATGMLVMGGHSIWFRAELGLMVPFALALGIVAAALPRRGLSGSRNPFIVAATGAAVGFMCYYLFPRWMLWGHLNVWRRVSWLHLFWVFSPDFEFQTASCWVAAGALAMLVTLTRRTPAVLVAVAVLCVLAIVLPAPAFNLLTNNQELTVAMVVPVSPGVSASKRPFVFSSGPHWLDQAGANAVAAHVLEDLRTSGLPGQYRITDIYRCGAGKKSLQIIVLDPPVPAQALLPQPDGTELIYVSKPDGWRTIPSQAPTLGRSVEVRGPETGRPYLARYCVPDAAGSGPCPAIRPD